jgi:hypothetical protein
MVRKSVRKDSTLKRKNSSGLDIDKIVDSSTKSEKKTQKKTETPISVSKTRVTGYIREDLHERLLDGINEERKKSRKRGDKSVQGKLDISAVMNESVELWLKKNKY